MSRSEVAATAKSTAAWVYALTLFIWSAFWGIVAGKVYDREVAGSNPRQARNEKERIGLEMVNRKQTMVQHCLLFFYYLGSTVGTVLVQTANLYCNCSRRMQPVAPEPFKINRHLGFCTPCYRHAISLLVAVCKASDSRSAKYKWFSAHVQIVQASWPSACFQRLTNNQAIIGGSPASFGTLLANYRWATSQNLFPCVHVNARIVPTCFIEMQKLNLKHAAARKTPGLIGWDPPADGQLDKEESKGGIGRGDREK